MRLGCGDEWDRQALPEGRGDRGKACGFEFGSERAGKSVKGRTHSLMLSLDDPSAAVWRWAEGSRLKPKGHLGSWW